MNRRSVQLGCENLLLVRRHETRRRRLPRRLLPFVLSSLVALSSNISAVSRQTLRAHSDSAHPDNYTGMPSSEPTMVGSIRRVQICTRPNTQKFRPKRATRLSSRQWCQNDLPRH